MTKMSRLTLTNTCILRIPIHVISMNYKYITYYYAVDVLYHVARCTVIITQINGILRAVCEKRIEIVIISFQTAETLHALLKWSNIIYVYLSCITTNTISAATLYCTPHANYVALCIIIVRIYFRYNFFFFNFFRSTVTIAVYERRRRKSKMLILHTDGRISLHTMNLIKLV